MTSILSQTLEKNRAQDFSFFNFACESITIVVYGGGHEKNRSQSESEIDIYILNALDWPFC